MKTTIFTLSLLATLFSASQAMTTEWPEECAETICDKYENYLPVAIVGTTPSEPAVNCTLERLSPVAGATNSVTTSLPLKTGSFVDSESLEHGEYSFSYHVGLYEPARDDDGIVVVFFENNIVQDQVAEQLCIFPRDATERFCQEPIFDFDGKHIFNFSCRRVI